ncbi:hypothetical protein pyei1_p21 [Paracoccus phage vB_PyeM_Pyei1]|nr:hypothetical protein pyei1_p21 [Paracoccus phage vB_PyeM_Pyei1]
MARASSGQAPGWQSDRFAWPECASRRCCGQPDLSANAPVFFAKFNMMLLIGGFR